MSDLSSQAAESRIVVNLVGDAVHGRLAESRFVDRPFLPGGEQNLYEFAFAVAALGREVELRGWLDRAVFERMGAGGGAPPAAGLAAGHFHPGRPRAVRMAIRRIRVAAGRPADRVPRPAGAP